MPTRTTTTTSRAFFYDVSGIFREARRRPHGIPRVEQELCRHLSADSRLIPVRYDSGAGRFMRLTPAERAYLDELLRREEVASPDYPYQSRSGRYSWVRHLYMDRREFRSRLAGRFVQRSNRSLAARTCREAVYAGVAGLYLALWLPWTVMQRVTADPLEVGADPDDRNRLIFVCELNSKRIAATRAQPIRLVHDLLPIDSPDWFRGAQKFAHRLRLASTACRRLIGVSEATCRRLEQWLADHAMASPPSVHAAPLPGFLHDLATEMQWAEPPLRLPRPFVLYCSTIDPRKNHATLLDVHARLLADFERGGPEPPDLVFVGEWTRRMRPLRRRIEASGFHGGRVHVLTDVDDAELCSLYRRAMFTVFPSLAEGWGLGASESLDFGTPVIVSTDAGLREATQGLMPAVAPHDVEGWYREMQRMSFDEAYREALRQRIRDRYVRRSVAEFAARFLAILDDADGVSAPAIRNVA